MEGPRCSVCGDIQRQDLCFEVTLAPGCGIDLLQRARLHASPGAVFTGDIEEDTFYTDCEEYHLNFQIGDGRYAGAEAGNGTSVI
jgi:hypothetical protein